MNTEQLKTDSQNYGGKNGLLKQEDYSFKTASVVDQISNRFNGLSGDTITLYDAAKFAQDFASQESKRAVDEALIDKDFIIYCLNQSWNYAHEQLQKKYLSDIERDIYQKQKDKAKALMTKLDSLT